jgi:hypothetical protein
MIKKVIERKICIYTRKNKFDSYNCINTIFVIVFLAVVPRLDRRCKLLFELVASQLPVRSIIQLTEAGKKMSTDLFDLIMQQHHNRLRNLRHFKWDQVIEFYSC